MEIESQIIKNIGIISFAGKMLGEPADSKVFETQLRNLISKGISQIILNLQNVKRINSTGLAILITATTLSSEHIDSKISLVGVNDFIQGALTLTRLNQFFEYYSTIEEAKT